MLLSFKTQINGQPTYFVEKIWQGLIVKNISDTVARYVWLQGTPYPKDNDRFKIGRKFQPKIHTIREDKNDRWKPGVLIDFFINARQKDMFRFAPRIPVVSMQEIEISRLTETFLGRPIGTKYFVFVDGKHLEDEQIEILARNDGFADGWEFFDYFNKNFKGKIIHWTNFKYE